MHFSRILPASAFLLIGFVSASGWAVPIGGFDIMSTSHFIDTRQSNTASVGVGTFDSFAINLSPTAGTTVTATQGTLVRDVPYLNSPALPFEFFRAIAFNPARTGSWDLAVTNPGVNAGATVHVATRTLATTTPPPFVNNVTLSGGGLTPTVAWERPQGYTPDNQSVFIFDKTNRTPTGASTLIFTRSVGATTNNFTIPAGVLTNGAQYTFAVQLDDRQSSNVPLSTTLVGRSRSFVDFTSLPPNFQGTVALPVVGVDANPNDNLGAPFQFDIGVSAGVPILIDPTFASGYEYRIEPGNPLITSVALPDIGDPSFDLYLWNGLQYVFDRALAPGVRHTFGGVGVDRFEILDIDLGLGVDPTNPLGFITELVFAGDGRFTGTQTPITQFGDLTVVPEPGTLFLTGLGFAALAWRRRRAA